MCGTCGCASQELGSHARSRHRLVHLEHEVLSKNQLTALRNRRWLSDRRILALNLVSSPGAGKTTLLERTIRDLRHRFPISVIEGDQETENDAQRIRDTGCPAVQINTGTGCHLDSEMVARALDQLVPEEGSLLFIENVGNLVCPSLFDLGERCKAVTLSVTEGEDKPLKYPHMFRASRILIINKIDLLAHVPFDLERCIELARKINPEIEIFPLSATRGDGLGRWYDWLQTTSASQQAPPWDESRRQSPWTY